MKKIQIDNNWNLDLEDDNNVVLVFQETRTRTKKDNSEEDYTYEDKFYYPTINSALKRYLDLSQKDAKTVEEIISITNETYKKIEKIKFK